MTLNAPLPPEAPAKPKTSRMAIASLVLGVVGPCTLGLASFAGIVLGVIGLGKIRKSSGRLGGRGWAIAGIVVSVVGVTLLPLIGLALAILIPAVSSARESALRVVATHNVKELYMAALVYAQDHKDAFPPADSWLEALTAGGATDPLLTDPADPQGGRAFALNAALAGKPRSVVTQRSRTVLFFECAPGGPTAGGPADLPPAPRHGRGYIIGFCDGHVEIVPVGQLGRLIWNPAGE